MSPLADRPASDQPMRIKGRNLTKHYRTVAGVNYALNGVSMDIRPGEMVVLLGPSGCGKTTLLRSIAGLEQPQTGELEIDGRVVYSADRGIWLPPERRGISMVFQSYALWPHMTVREIIAYPLVTRKISRAETLRRVTQVMDVVGLGALADRLPSQLSGGQQQRVALARAIVADTQVVLFDEPLSNVDAQVRDQIRREIVALQRQLGFSGLYVTHDQVEAGALADTLVVMDHGRVAQVGPPAAVYESPVTRYVAAFMGQVNETGGVVMPGAAEGYVAVETRLGKLVGSPRAGADVAGAPVTALFRPEACVLTSGRNSDVNTWPCTIQRSVFMGALVELWLCVDMDGVVLDLMALAPKHAFREGNAAWLHVPPASVWVFAT